MDKLTKIVKLASLRDREEAPVVMLQPKVEHNPGKPWRVTGWLASTKNGTLAGEGATPEEALDNLHRCLSDAHRAIDRVRAKALAEASAP